MKITTSSKQLKYRAKQRLSGWFTPAVSATITMQLLTLAVSIMIRMISDTRTLPGLIIFYAMELLLSLLTVLLASGQCFMYLNLCCNRPILSSMLFFGFKNQPEKAILIHLMQMLLYIIAVLPSLILTVIGTALNLPVIILVGLLCLLPAAIFIFSQALAFSQVLYLLYDFPEHTANELLMMSKKLMTGHRLRLLYILLSFFPLYLLSMLSLGIGLLWVIPYVNTTTTEFFLDLMKQNTQA